MVLDLDEMFSYRTVRLAEIRDYRIGIPYYILVLCISVDIFVVQVRRSGAGQWRCLRAAHTAVCRVPAPCQRRDRGPMNAR